MTLDNILIPTDFSACADHALTHAVDLADRFDARLHLLHVVNELDPDWYGITDAQKRAVKLRDQIEAEARETVDTIQWDDYQTQLEGAVQGALHLLKACLPGMREAGQGRFVGISSNLVQDPAVPYHDYTTGKAALLGFVRNVAQELGDEGITANLVSGGLLDRTDASAATSDAVFDIIRQNTPRGTVTTPEEVADAVLFFASPWARAVTGQTLIVDGGLVMQ